MHTFFAILFILLFLAPVFFLVRAPTVKAAGVSEMNPSGVSSSYIAPYDEIAPQIEASDDTDAADDLEQRFPVIIGLWHLIGGNAIWDVIKGMYQYLKEKFKRKGNRSSIKKMKNKNQKKKKRSKK